MDRSTIVEILEDATSDEVEEIGDRATASAMQVAVRRLGGESVDVAVGHTRLDAAAEPVTTETPFDVASLTKPVVTGTLLMQAVAEGRCSWDEPVDGILGEWNDSSAAPRVTLAHLANHTSGLPDWRPFYEDLSLDPSPQQVADHRESVRAAIRQTELEAPPGEREVYSDLGYIVLGWALEQLFGAPLDDLARRRIFEPLGMSHTRFVSAARGDAPVAGAVATEDDDLRGGVVAGRVHDRNTAALGGVAGHAGLFSTASDLATFGMHLLAVDRGTLPADVSPLVDAEVLAQAWSESARGGHGHHLLGWDTPSGSPSSAGRTLQDGSTVGHLGFTGTSIWMERDAGLVIVLLTNRVYPSRQNDRIRPLRIRLHEAIAARELDAPTPAS